MLVKVHENFNVMERIILVKVHANAHVDLYSTILKIQGNFHVLLRTMYFEVHGNFPVLLGIILLVKVNETSIYFLAACVHCTTGEVTELGKFNVFFFSNLVSIDYSLSLVGKISLNKLIIAQPLAF